MSTEDHQDWEPLERIRACRTLLDTFLAADSEAEFATFWNAGAESSRDSLSVGSVRGQAWRAAQLLEDRGVRHGDRVALVLQQGPELLIAFIGSMMLGAVPSILAYPNFKIDPEKYQTGLAGVMLHLEARVALIDRDFPTRLRPEIEDRTTLLEISSALLQGVEDPKPKQLAAEPGDLVFIQHSAGTTGLQKAVALSHEVVLQQLESLARVLELRKQDRIASWLPLYHDMGLVAGFMLPLASGLPLALQSPLDWVLNPVSFLQFAARERSSLTWLPNFAFQFMSRKAVPETLGELDLGSLRAIISCSEPVRAQSLDEFRSRFETCGLQVEALQTSYAMAENVFAVTQSPLEVAANRLWVDRQQLLQDGMVKLLVPEEPESICLVSSGRPLPGTALRIVDPEGEVLLPGHVGEIQIRSQSLFAGYYGRPETRQSLFQDSWYRSGDSGFLYQGELFVLGRQDDVIIVAGRNIFPEDVEAIAARHPLIQDGRVVAFGVDSPELGTQDLIIVAELKSRHLDVDRTTISVEIRQAIRLELDISPRQVAVVDPPWLIKSSAGKPARSATREKFFKQRLESQGREG